jgi:hypothetical protein
MRTVALVGTSHKYQLPATIGADDFQTFLANICIASKVTAIGEEMSVEGLMQKCASESVCKTISNTLSIAHYCDMDNEQRKARSVIGVLDIEYEAYRNDWSCEKLAREIRTSHDIRERYWLGELLDLNTWPVIFVCGADHVEPFRTLLETNGLHVDIVARDWPLN